jgi:hypothetical protein
VPTGDLKMSRHFAVKEIFVLTGPATVNIEDKPRPYINPDFKPGSLFAIDVNGDMYYFDNPVTEPPDLNQYMGKNSTPVDLWRDNWKYFDAEPGFPYRDSIDSAPKESLFQTIQ